MKSIFRFTIITLLGLIFMISPRFANADHTCNIVVAKEGIYVYEEPSLNSKKLHHLPYLETIEDAFVGGRRNSIVPKMIYGKDTVFSYFRSVSLGKKFGYEKKLYGYILMNKYSAISNNHCGLYDYEEYVEHEYSTDTLEKYLKFERANELEFLEAKAKTESYIDTANSKLYQLGTTVKLPIKKRKPKVFKSVKNPDNEENDIDYTYIGKCVKLNTYIVKQGYWEGGEYLFVNIKKGHTIGTTFGYPIISPDGKNIIEFEIYEEALILKTVTKDTITTRFSAMQFKNWNYYDDYAWASENELIIKVRLVFPYMTSDDWQYPQVQFIRIKIL